MSLGQLLNKLNQRSTPILPKNKFFRFSLIIVGLLSLIVISKNTLAASNSFIDKKNAIKTGNNQEAWLNEAMGSNMVSLFTGLVGDVPDEIFNKDWEKGTSQIRNKYFPGGAFGSVNKYIATLQSPPISGIEYIAQVRDNFLGKPVYAQGVGFQGLHFLLPLWRGFRNVVYVISTLVFIIIGLMIMLRIKISPQAVITIQSAIPKLITTLILVTFSYAIAGLIIDLSNFLQGFVVAIFFSVRGKDLGQNLFSEFRWGDGSIPLVSDLIAAINSVLTMFQNSFNFNHLSNPNLQDAQSLTFRAIPGWSSFMMLGSLLGSMVIGFLVGGATYWLGVGPGWVSNTINWIAGDVAGGITGGVIGLLIMPTVLCILAMIWLIKLYFGLIKCYVTLIFKILLGPLEIGMGAFPNSKMGFSTWITDVISNMAVFPVVGIFLVLLNLIIDDLEIGGGSTVWVPNILSDSSISVKVISAIIGFAGLAILSKLPSIVPEFIFKIKPSPFGAAIGEGLSDISKSPIIRTVKGGAANYAADQIDEGSSGRFPRIGAFIEKTTNRLDRTGNGDKIRKNISDSIRQAGKG